MALDPLMRSSVERIAQSLRSYAARNGMSEGDYDVFVRPDRAWDQLHFAIVAERFPGDDVKAEWMKIMRSTEGELPGIREHLTAFNLSLLTRAQVEKGGFYSLGADFLRLEDLLAQGASA